MSESPSITLAHGDGGGVTMKFIRDEILNRFGNPILNVLEDGSWIPLKCEQVVISTDSYIVDPPIFPGGDIGKLAIAGTVNDLLASGALPLYLTLSLILTEGVPLSSLSVILDSAQQTAQAARVQIVAGDTKVLERQPKTGIYINTTGLGLPMAPRRNYAVSNAMPGDKIIVTGAVGDHGLAVLSAREGLGFETRVQSDCAPLHDLIIPILRVFDAIHSMRDPTRGGLLGTLIDIAESSTVELLVEREAIPIKSEVRFGCEMLGLDPLSLANEGKMVLVVAPEQADGVLAHLRRHPLGSESALIGEVLRQEFRGNCVVMKQGRTKRLAMRPAAQSLPRLC